ncbi:MAG: hypothetical protein NW224_04450 [Leptolyngbyaceae cyanobacterium bins.302]|nr:hypothetical protein [Leptolyngbyaceae cyanobacterium bins.302]
MLSSIDIQPLSQQKLCEAQSLVDETFPHYPWLNRRLFFSVSKPKIVYRWALFIGWQVTFLRDLFASTHLSEVNAQPLYERFGFQVTRKELWKGTPYERIYRELEL